MAVLFAHLSWADPSFPTLSAETIVAIENGLVPRVIVDDERGKTYNLEARLKQFQTPGLSVAVFSDRKILWAQGFGLRSSESTNPVDPQTRFQAASIGKSVTAIAVLTLVEAKHLDLDADINHYLRTWKVPESALTRVEKVTIRRLLNHTAGLNVGGFPGYEKTDKIPDTTGVLDGRGNSPALRVETTPGTRHSYSGGGYVVLQKLIEDLSGETFAAYVTGHILKPLQMNDSSFDPHRGDNVSMAHGFDGRPYRGGWHVYPELAAAGLWTTPSDLARFTFGLVRAIEGAKGALISKSLARQLFAPSGAPGGGDQYALGFELRGRGANASIGHGGSNAGFKSELFYFPARKLGLVLMTNAENGRVVRNELARSISNQFELGLFPPRAVQRLTLADSVLQSLTGTYLSNGEQPQHFVATATHDELMLTNLDTRAVNHLVAIEPDTFVDRFTGVEVVVLRRDSAGVSLRYDDEDTLTKLPVR